MSVAHLVEGSWWLTASEYSFACFLSSLVTEIRILSAMFWASRSSVESAEEKTSKSIHSEAFSCGIYWTLNPFRMFPLLFSAERLISNVAPSDTCTCNLEWNEMKRSEICAHKIVDDTNVREDCSGKKNVHFSYRNFVTRNGTYTEYSVISGWKSGTQTFGLFGNEYSRPTMWSSSDSGIPNRCIDRE